MTDQVRLNHDGWDIRICPEFGASVAVCQYEGRDILRPVPNDWDGDPLSSGSFPMAPFSGRIDRGKFEYGGRQVSLSPTHPKIDLPIHGYCWCNQWTVNSVMTNAATFTLICEQSEWPWGFRADYEISIDGQQFWQALHLTNLSNTPMPYGLGFHPFFPKSSNAHLRFSAEDIWRMDDNLIPCDKSPIGAIDDFGQGRALEGLIYDHCFSGIGGESTVNNELLIKASDNLDHAILYTPQSEDFFCFEPVSHRPDAFNGDNPNGLEPGDRVEAWMTISVS